MRDIVKILILLYLSASWCVVVYILSDPDPEDEIVNDITYRNIVVNEINYDGYVEFGDMELESEISLEMAMCIMNTYINGDIISIDTNSIEIYCQEAF